MGDASKLKVGVTLEQLWHRVPGGTAVAAVETVRALASRGDIEVVGIAALHAGHPSGGWTPPVTIRQLPLPRMALYEAWHRLRLPTVERAAGTVDVIHATTIAIPPRSAPLVVTIHDLAFIRFPGHFTKRGLHFFRRGLRLALEEADLVLCPSKATMRDCEAEGFSSRRLRLVPNGVRARPASIDEIEETKRRYKLFRPYVLGVGTIQPRKNPGALIRAFSSIDDDLDLVLAGPKGWNERLKPLIDSVGARVKTLGFVPWSDLGPLYAGARVFCYPSLLEGFGLPVLEAMAQGTPVVTSSGTSTEELAQSAGVLVDPHDVESIAAGLERLLNDEDLARRLGERGRERAAAYSWERTGELSARAYREVA